MARLFALALLAGLLSSVPAFAVESLAKVRCEDPEIIAAINHGLAIGQLEDGRRMSTIADIGHVRNLKTVSATKTKLVCTMIVRITFEGQSIDIRATMVTESIGGHEPRNNLYFAQ